MLYRICTEDKNRDQIHSIIRKYLMGYIEGYTLIPSEGCWKGQKEKSLTIEVVASVPMHSVVKDCIQLVANEIKVINDQEAILIEIMPCDYQLL